ncbi:MAG: IS4 family transposase [Gammaproteobacteria bacterium]
MDRTNWWWGKSSINILTLGIAHEGISIPLFWNLLKGTSSTGDDQFEIVKRFVKVFGKDCIAGVLADREFANKYFFRNLVKAKIPFYIRVKEGSKANIFYEKTFKVKKLFNQLKQKSQMSYIQPVTIHGQKLFVAAGRSESGELLLVATNQYKAKNAVSIYLRRWEIEVLFQSLKSRGFNFEDTHITKRERIETLMSLLVVGFSWAHKIGEWRDTKKPVVFNKYRDGRRPQYSFFRYGLDFIRDVILHVARLKKQFRRCLKLLFFPPKPLKTSIQETIS